MKQEQQPKAIESQTPIRRDAGLISLPEGIQVYRDGRIRYYWYNQITDQSRHRLWRLMDQCLQLASNPNIHGIEEDANPLLCSGCCATITLPMTYYHIPSGTLPSFAAQEAKAQRKHLLERIRKQRYQSEKERRKTQQKAYTSSEEYREYQKQLKEEARP